MIAAAGLGQWVYALLAGPLDDVEKLNLVTTALCLMAAGVMGLLGAIDDILDLRARLKLLIQLAVAAAFAIVVAHVDNLPLGAFDLPLGHLLGSVGTILWLVVAVNAVNFMDGSNGLAAGSTAIAFLTVAIGELRRPGAGTGRHRADRLRRRRRLPAPGICQAGDCSRATPARCSRASCWLPSLSRALASMGAERSRSTSSPSPSPRC